MLREPEEPGRGAGSGAYTASQSELGLRSEPETTMNACARLQSRPGHSRSQPTTQRRRRPGVASTNQTQLETGREALGHILARSLFTRCEQRCEQRSYTCTSRHCDLCPGSTQPLCTVNICTVHIVVNMQGGSAMCGQQVNKGPQKVSM